MIIKSVVSKALLFVISSILLSGCVSLDRMLTPITDHTQHYSFTYGDVVSGGVIVGGLTDSSSDRKWDEEVDWSASVSDGISKEREQYVVRGDGAVQEVLGIDDYSQMLSQYRTERWIDIRFMAKIRESLPERYVVLATIDRVGEGQSSYCSKRKKKKKKDEDGNDTDEDEDGPDIYDITRSSGRTATVSADVFDLAQDIIVWSGTREASVGRSNQYESSHYVGDYSYLETFPYPSYPSWFFAFKTSAKGLAIHMPHKSD